MGLEDNTPTLRAIGDVLAEGDVLERLAEL
jgi:hypothetical protein